MGLDRPASTLGGVHPLLQPGVNRFHVCLHCGTHCSHHLTGLHGCESHSRGTRRQNVTYAEGGNSFHSWKAKNQCRSVETDKCPELKNLVEPLQRSQSVTSQPRRRSPPTNWGLLMKAGEPPH